MAFLREDFAVKESNNNYMRLEDGENKVRILTDAIDGYLYWLDSEGELVPRGEMGGKGSKPIRVKSLDEASKKNEGAQYDSKQFIAFVVWNYEESKMQILEVTQTTIIKALQGLEKSKDWGDVMQYDIVIERSGQKLDTEYSVRPVPPKEFKEDVSGLAKVNLEALYESGDPFEALSGMDENLTDKEIDEVFEKDEED